MNRATTTLALRSIEADLSDATANREVDALRHIRIALRLLADEEAVPEAKPQLDRPLSDREEQVLALLAQGKRASDIAATMGLSIKTVSTYRTRALMKIGLNTTGELIRWGIERGYV